MILLKTGDEMYNIIKDSLINPKNLLTYRNKKGLFTFFYLILLTVFVSIGGFIYYFKLPNPQVLSSQIDFCEYTDEGLSCQGTNYKPEKSYEIYGFPTYFLDDFDTIESIGIMPTQSIVFSKHALTFYQGNQAISSIDLTPLLVTENLSGIIIFIGKILLSVFLVLSFIGNLVMLLIVAFISTIPFYRLKKFIPYKKIYKLVLFATTPFAVLMTFYNLIDFPEWLFFILMLVAYRSVFALQREMYLQTYMHINAQNPKPEDVTEEAEIIVSDDSDSDDNDDK